MELKILNKGDDSYDYGDTVYLNEFQGEGVLCISGYDGWTKLNKEEAKKLGEALIAWSNT